MEISAWYKNPESEEGVMKKRLDAATYALDSISAIAGKIQDEEVTELINGVLRDVAVGLPDSQRYLVPIQGSDQPTIVFVPLFTEDTDINKTTKSLMMPSLVQAARFTENNPGRIYFNAEIPLSPLLNGLVMLHEAKHALIYESGLFRNGEELDYWREEVNVFEFELRLLRQICGDEYDTFVAKTMERFVNFYNDQDGKGGTLLGPESIDIGQMGEGLGTSTSERDAKLRRSIVWMDVVFRMFDKVYPKTSTDDKSRLLQQMGVRS